MRTPAPGAGRLDRAGSNVDAGDLRQEYAEVSLLRLELTDRRSDLGGREDRRRHLVEQRLKYVVIAPVDQHDLGIGVPQRVRRRKPGKAAADDHDTLALRTRRLHDSRCLIRPSVGQHRAHGSPCSCSLSFMASANSLPVQCSQPASHSGLLEPRGTSTVLKEPGVRDITIWSVIP